MIIGGGDPATDKVSIADLSVANPTYANAPNLNHARMHLMAVILPDRTVFVSGGSGIAEQPMTAVLESEIYNPPTNTWEIGAKASVPRMYHASALLLPDGRVITAGSNPNRKDDELRLELYHPPYLFKGPRPIISNLTQNSNINLNLHCGAKFEIESPQAMDIKWVHLIKPMATTHSWDSSQRLINIPFSCEEVCHLHACTPENNNLVPPGWYMLFIVNNQDIPSVAKWVHLEVC